MNAILDRWREHGLTISLLLTQRCNFECEHCFYSCSPKMSGKYMSNEVLDAVYDQVRILKDEHEAYCTINLIGGEPTLDMDRFQEILRYVYDWDCQVTITTNGWWLERDDTALRFMKIVAPYVDANGDGQDSIDIRISGDRHHDRFRPSWLQGTQRLRGRLDDLWDSVFYKEIFECDYCGRVARESRDTCSKCGEKIYPREELRLEIPRPDPSYPWIFVEGGKDSHIVPIGRAEYWGSNDKGAGGYCGVGDLTYTPDGKLTDVCCSGSNCRFGTAYDHPIILLEAARQFVEDALPSCRECHEKARRWARYNLGRVRAQVASVLDMELEYA